MGKCPHIEKCDQKIDRSRFPLCLGKVEDWDFDSCFKYRDSAEETERTQPTYNIKAKFAKEWAKGHPTTPF